MLTFYAATQLSRSLTSAHVISRLRSGLAKILHRNKCPVLAGFSVWRACTVCCSAAITFHNIHYRSALIVSAKTRGMFLLWLLSYYKRWGAAARVGYTGSGVAARVSLCKNNKNAYFLGPDYFKKKKVDRLSPRTPLARHFNFSNFKSICNSAFQIPNPNN